MRVVFRATRALRGVLDWKVAGDYSPPAQLQFCLVLYSSDR